jgi:hypothetical protein
MIITKINWSNLNCLLLLLPPQFSSNDQISESTICLINDTEMIAVHLKSYPISFGFQIKKFSPS